MRARSRQDLGSGSGAPASSKTRMTSGARWLRAQARTDSFPFGSTKLAPASTRRRTTPAHRPVTASLSPQAGKRQAARSDPCFRLERRTLDEGSRGRHRRRRIRVLSTRPPTRCCRESRHSELLPQRHPLLACAGMMWWKLTAGPVLPPVRSPVFKLFWVRVQTGGFCPAAVVDIAIGESAMVVATMHCLMRRNATLGWGA